MHVRESFDHRFIPGLFETFFKPVIISSPLAGRYFSGAGDEAMDKKERGTQNAQCTASTVLMAMHSAQSQAETG